MDTKLNLQKKATIKANFDAILADLPKVEPLLGIFPKLEKLSDLGKGAFETQLKPIGAMGVEYAVCYAADYKVEGHSLTFTGIKGKGNALLSGQFKFEQKGDKIEVEVDIEGQLRDIKVPMLMRPATPGFIKTMFEGLVDRFIEKVEQKYSA